MKIIGYIHTDFPEKFGIPRQSGLVPELRGYITFLPKYRNPDAFKGLEGFNYIWLLWRFDVPEREGYSASVKPPRLGGNTPMGVFATRSPFRPNPIGLSSVRLERVEFTQDGPVLHVMGADLRDGTAIYDIKPYLPGVDSHPDATDGFVGTHAQVLLEVEIDPELIGRLQTAGLSERQLATLREILAQDPRPAYHAAHADPGRIYGLSYAGHDIHFTVDGRHLKAF